MFGILKSIHVTTVILTVSLLVVRWFWALRNSPQLQRPTVRILPHVNDTILFGAAVGMTLMLHQYPFFNGWLTAKLLGLLAYIVLGHIALKRALSKTQRVVALLAALTVFAYIVQVARCQDAMACLRPFTSTAARGEPMLPGFGSADIGRQRPPSATAGNAPGASRPAPGG